MIIQSILGWDKQDWWYNSCCSLYEFQFSFSKIQSWFSCSELTTESLVQGANAKTLYCTKDVKKIVEIFRR